MAVLPFRPVSRIRDDDSFMYAEKLVVLFMASQEFLSPFEHSLMLCIALSEGEDREKFSKAYPDIMSAYLNRNTASDTLRERVIRSGYRLPVFSKL